MNVNLEDSISDDKALKNSAIKSLLFTPKRSIGNHLFPPKQKLEVSLWSEMETRRYPKRVTLISNLIHDREAIMLYSPTGVGKTWLSLSIAMMVAGKGQLEVLDWENKDPQPVCYVDGEMLEEDMQERIKMLIPSLNVDEEELRKNFRYLSRVSQPDEVDEFLSLDLEENQMELLRWLHESTEKGKSPLVLLDNLSNLVELGDDNSAGQMQPFNMMVTKARKQGCSMGIIHHTGKAMTIGPDGIPTWRGSYDMATRLDKTICLLPCKSSLDGYVTFQVLEGKSRRGQRINMSIQFNPFERRWELFDESSTEDRHQLIKGLLEESCVAKIEDLSIILDRSPSSSERYLKQAIESEVFSDKDWKNWKSEAKYNGGTKDERIQRGKKYLEENFRVLMNEKGRGGRYVVERKIFENTSDF